MRRSLAALILGTGAMLGILLLAAGRMDAPWLWVYATSWGLYAFVSIALAQHFNPDLLAERMKPPSDQDRLTRRLAAPCMLAHLVLAGLDVRLGWSDVGTVAHVSGMALLGLGWAMVAWTFASNRFASSSVRIQHDRGHAVVDRGPYAWVRHPMYLGVLLTAMGAGPAVGSWWAGLALAPLFPIFWRRTRLEDGLLLEELPGYRHYAARVRWRLLPGVY